MVEEAVRGASKGLFAKLDEMTFKATINGLKCDDYAAICITIDQLVKDKKPVSIPPLYVVSQAHPNLRARAKATEAISLLDSKNEVPKLTEGKSLKDSTEALIKRFGNYKS